MLSASIASSPAGQPAHLYDLVATSEGIHVSSNSADGHVLVMELLSRLGWMHQRQQGERENGSQSDATGPVMPFRVRPPAPPWTGSPSLGLEQKETLPLHEPNTGPVLPVAHAAPGRAPNADTPGANVAPEVIAPSRGKRISELMAFDLANLAGGAKKATPATRDRQYIMTLLLDVLGDKPVADVTATDANAMADVLASWPRNRANYPEFKDLPARQVAAITKKKKLAVIQRSTQHKHIMALNAFFNWCVKLGAVRENPFHYVRSSRYRDAVPKKRDIFTAQNLQALFAPQHLTNYTEPHKYWVPLIAMFTGMRVNEISQLYVDDVQSDIEMDDDGVEYAIPYFDIAPFHDGQSVKTGYSVRRIPIHSRLLELGFERYVADVRASGSEHLFPGLAWAEGGPGRTVSRWFNKYHLRQTCGITSSKKSLHCFRHTLTTRCKRANVSNGIVITINGHSDGQGVDDRYYMARGTLLECQKALEQVKYPPLELVPYASERFADYLAQVAAQAAHGDRLTAEGKPVISRKGRRPKIASKTHQTPVEECLP